MWFTRMVVSNSRRRITMEKYKYVNEEARKLYQKIVKELAEKEKKEKENNETDR